jgi:hypothetical protein
MKKSILNLEGVQTLNKNQRREVKGGKVNCSLPASTSLIIACCCYNIKPACIALGDPEICTYV